MMLDITDALRAPGEEIPFVHQENLEPQEILGETVSFLEPLTMEGVYGLVEDELFLQARLRATASATCARCLKEVSYQVDIPVKERYTRLDRRALPEEEDPWEESQVFSGHQVDLFPLMRTLTLLDLPIRFLCSKSCKGLTEWQEQETQEQEPEETLDDAHPFGALKQLFTKDQEV